MRRYLVPLLAIVAVIACKRTPADDAERFIRFAEGSVSATPDAAVEEAAAALDFQKRPDYLPDQWLGKSGSWLAVAPIHCGALFSDSRDRRLKYILSLTAPPGVKGKDFTSVARDIFGEPRLKSPHDGRFYWQAKNGVIAANERSLMFVKGALEDYIEDPKQPVFPDESTVIERLHAAGFQRSGSSPRGYRNYSAAYYVGGGGQYVLLSTEGTTRQALIAVYFESQDMSESAVGQFTGTLALPHLESKLTEVFRRYDVIRREANAGYIASLSPVRAVRGNFGLQVSQHPNGDIALFVVHRGAFDYWNCSEPLGIEEGKAVWID